MRRTTLIAYVVLLHALFAIVLWKSDFLPRLERKLGWVERAEEITDHYRGMVQYHGRMDANVPDNAVIFIGDSLTQGLYVDAVARPSVNYGIGSDTTVGVLGRLGTYRSVYRASAVVLAIGAVDMRFRDNREIVRNYGRILAALPPHVAIVCSAVLPVHEAMMSPRPVTNARIRDLNLALGALCAGDARCVFVDAGKDLMDAGGQLSALVQVGDGIHLNSTGNRIWSDALRPVIERARNSASR